MQTRNYFSLMSHLFCSLFKEKLEWHITLLCFLLKTDEPHYAAIFHCLSPSASGVDVFIGVIHTLYISNEQMIHKLCII